MSIEIVTLIIWGSLLVLMFTGFSIAFSLLAVSVMGYIVFIGPSALPNLYSVTYRSITLVFSLRFRYSCSWRSFFKYPE